MCRRACERGKLDAARPPQERLEIGGAQHRGPDERVIRLRVSDEHAPPRRDNCACQMRRGVVEDDEVDVIAVQRGGERSAERESRLEAVARRRVPAPLEEDS